MKHIQFDITDSEYRTIADVARQRGSTVTDVLRGAAAATAREYARPFNQHVAQLHAEGLTASQIGNELGTTVTKVRAALSSMGLSPNRPAPTPRPARPVTPRSRGVAS